MAVPVMTIDGDVVAIHSYWTGDPGRIVTDATIHTSDGRDVVVNQVGGTVDGIGMIQFPGDGAPLEPGMRVAIAAHVGRDLSQQEHIVLDSVRVLSYPEGFVRTGPTDSGHYLYWESGCAFITVDSAGTTAIAGDGEFAVVDTAIATWNTATDSCSYFKVIDEGRRSLDTGNDKVNLIKFRDTPIQCEPGDGTTVTTWGMRPATKTTPVKCYSTQAAAITTAVYVNDPSSKRDGAILDADIELNGVNFTIAVNGQSTANHGCVADLQNTLTHELGHFHGLEHPCRLSSLEPERIDDQGNPVPICTSGLPPKITEATMYPTQDCGETSKSTLTDDDIDAVCKIYPNASDPGTCEQVMSSGGGGCCSASGTPPAASLLLAGMTMFFITRRRKNSRSA